MNEEEKIAFNFYKGCNKNDLKRFDDFSEVSKKQIKYTETLLNLIEKQQKEIEFYKIQELEYIQGYEDGKSHKQTAVAIKNENAQYELIKRVIEEKDKEIEQMKTKINKTLLMIKENYNSDFYDDYETIAGLRDDIYNLLTKKYNVGE